MDLLQSLIDGFVLIGGVTLIILVTLPFILLWIWLFKDIN